MPIVNFAVSAPLKQKINYALEEYGFTSQAEFFRFLAINFLEKKNNNVHIGHSVYKIRLKSSNLNRGKRNSFRLIILLIEVDNIITPITMYFKGDKENISKKEISYHEKTTINELKLLSKINFKDLPTEEEWLKIQSNL